MAQGKLIKVEESKEGIKLTFLDYENKEYYGIYNNGLLTAEQLTKLIGHHVSISNKTTEKIEIKKAWEPCGRVSFCDDPKHGFDR